MKADAGPYVLLANLRLIVIVSLLQAADGAELSKGHMLQAVGHPVTALAFSHDGRMLASGSIDGAVSIWQVASNRLVRTSPVHIGQVAAVAFSPDGELIVSGGQDRILRVWTVFGGKELRKLDGHTSGVSALAFSPDGKTLVSGGTDGALVLWNTQGWTLSKRLTGHPTRVHTLRVSSNNEFLASGSDEYIRIWNLTAAAHSFDTPARSGPVRALSYRDPSGEDGKPKFISCNGNELRAWGPSGVVGTQIIAPWNGRYVGVFFAQSQDEPCVVATENGFMATGGTNGVVEIWQSRRNGVKLSAHNGRVESMALSPGGVRLASGGQDGTVKLWNARMLMDQASFGASQ